MLVTLLPIVIEVKLEQFMNAFSLMLDTLFPISQFIRDLPSIALLITSYVIISLRISVMVPSVKYNIVFSTNVLNDFAYTSCLNR